MSRARPASGRFDEAEAVRLFSRSFAQRGAPGVELGIGDDAAVLSPSGGRLVWTVDAQVEGTHFERAWLGLPDIGFRAFQAAASDLAAMGAKPLAALSALTLPRGFSRAELARLSTGQAEAARACRCPIVGGNVARGPVLTLTTTLLGTVKHPLARHGARPGDEVWLVGEVGLSAAGLALLQSGRTGARARSTRRALTAFRRPRALLTEGTRLARVAHAAIDVSDGLALDTSRMAEASGCRLVLEEEALSRVLSAELVTLTAALGRSALELALTGGEDFALLATGAPRQRPRFARRIGRCERGRGGFWERADGRTARLAGGFDHFAR
ncbi:MAG TPA: thiamine-phosphate kinase [Polyangiaceae bacterium]|nr:thiamine-phosphate kinase [Polyangiaceae bacterium]